VTVYNHHLQHRHLLVQKRCLNNHIDILNHFQQKLSSCWDRRPCQKSRVELLCPFLWGGGAGSPSDTMWLEPRSIPCQVAS